MKTTIAILLIAASFTANAQIFNKINNGINNGNGIINNTNNIAGQIKSAIPQNQPASNAAPATQQPAAKAPIVNTTVITLNNTDYDKTTNVVNLIKGIATVSGVSKKINGNTAIITVSHSDATDNLIDALNAKGIFTISMVDTGVATLALK